MKNKLIIIVIGIVILSIMVWCCFVYVTPCRDECTSLSQLPIYGSEFSSKNLGKIQYTASRPTRVVLAKVNTTCNEFDMLVSKFKLNKFRADPESEFFNDYNKEFCPRGNWVHGAYGKMYANGGRAVIRLYFETTNEEETSGVLYIHIS